MRWLLGNFADPQYRLTPEQQHEVTRIAHEKYLPAGKLFRWTGWMVVAAIVVVFAGAKPLARLITGVPAAEIVSVVILILVVSAASAWAYRFLYRRPVRRAMRDLGFDVCLGCGYRLDGLGPDAERCPECGAERAPDEPAAP